MSRPSKPGSRFHEIFCVAVCAGALLLANGAPASETNLAAPNSDKSDKETHWSLKPVTRPIPPPIANRKWSPRNPIDNFIYAKLADAELSPSPEASRRALIRRLYFDLIGLPPTPEQVRAFLRDSSANAYTKVVETLLNSPQYGERWAQHWLDVVRFAESNGFEMNQPRPNAWRYRDYVIEAFNQDKPYNRFILEQFAGDLFGADAATGFLVAGAWDQVKSPDPVLTAAQRADELHDMVGTSATAFLGLTVGCARCHNHKFDPLPQTDYYAFKACLAGVQHGERRLRTPESIAREEQADAARKRLATIEDTLAQFEPLASTRRILLLEPEPVFGSRLVQQLKPARRINFPAGTARGERDDPGDLTRLPTFTKNYLAWTNSANTDVLAFEPGLSGRFQLRLSWACGSETHARDAHYILDRDGDLTTTNDQTEIARIDQQRFAEGSGQVPVKQVWSGFYDAGVWDLASSNKIVLRSGASESVVTAGVLALVEAQPSTNTPLADLGSGGGDQPHANSDSPMPRSTDHFLRAQVNPRRNVERFVPIRAKRLRFTVARTTDAEPCLDELEVYTAQPNPSNIALASAGTKATASSVFPNSDIHRLEHLNDGKFGNSHSWISNERGKGWVELEFANEATINRVVWGRDREQQFSDRLALDYRIEVALGSNDWRLVASSQDRVPYNSGRTSSPSLNLIGLSQADASRVSDLLTQRAALEASLKELTTFPMAYAGMLTEKPEPTHRLQRGDPMQKREVIEPGVLTAIPVKFQLPDSSASSSTITDDQHRRLALANWIANPSNPLPARVMVNRLWQHHFGEGLVSTPSDFGKNGARPSHPELLDWLASEFVSPTTRAVRNEPQPMPLSVKHIHWLIVTSAAYRQSSDSQPAGIARDAGDRLIWRFPPQRLEAEPLRDTILSVSGKLELHQGGPGFSAFEANDNYVRVYDPKKEFGPSEWRRMIYMTKVRMHQDSTFGAFDCPDGGQIAPKRMHSTTPLQALNLLNSQFLVQQAGFFAERLEREAPASVDARINRAFELAYNRSPDPQEARAAKLFITQYGLPLFCRALFNSNEFLFME
jgi:hypothetical protein